MFGLVMFGIGVFIFACQLADKDNDKYNNNDGISSNTSNVAKTIGIIIGK